MTGIATTALPLQVLRRGKVRDVYEVDVDRLLVVATDRVSAFDVVMRETVPFKGAVLTQLTAWWLRRIERAVHHHMIASDVDTIRCVPRGVRHSRVHCRVRMEGVSDGRDARR